MRATLVILIVCFASIALADDFKTIEGKEYKDAKVSRIEPDGLVLITKSGISKVYFSELPKEVQERFHYDPQRAAEFTSQTVEQNRLWRQQRAEEEQKRAEERKKYQSEHPLPSSQTGRAQLSDSAPDDRARSWKTMIYGTIRMTVEEGLLIRVHGLAFVGQERIPDGADVLFLGNFPGFYNDDKVQASGILVGQRDHVTLGSHATFRETIRAFEPVQIKKLSLFPTGR